MGMKIFEASGTFKPSDYGITADTRVDILAVGGGGGGQNGRYDPYDRSCGGNSGCIEYHSGELDPDTSYAVTVGTGGNGGTDQDSASTDTPENGSSGGSSSFGSLVTALGGSGGGVSPSVGSSHGGTGYDYSYSTTKSASGGGGAGGFEPNYDHNFANGGTQNIATDSNGGSIVPGLADSIGNGGGCGACNAYREGISYAFGGNGGTYHENGKDGNRGAVGGSSSIGEAGGGGAGGGYGAGGGGGAYYANTSTPIYYNKAGGKGANGVVIVFW